MQLILNIYKNGEVEKTYTANEYDILFGTVEDLVNIIDMDALTDAGNKDSAAAMVRMVTGGMEQVKGLLKDIFSGVTEEELKRTKIKEVIPLMMSLVKYSIKEISLTNTGTGKN